MDMNKYNEWPANHKGDKNPSPKIIALGKRITDVAGHMIGGVTAEDPEYWGLAEIITEEMAEVGLTMKRRAHYTFDQLCEMNKDKVAEKGKEGFQKLLDEMSYIGLLEYDYGYHYDHNGRTAPQSERRYIGTMVQGKYGSVSYKTKQNRPRPKETWYRKENTHEAIIDQELWNTVQRMLEEKAKPFATGKTGIFAGKVKCADCGYHMRSTKTKDRYYLKCATHHIAKDACEGAFISVKALEDAVLSEIHRMSKEYLDIETLEKNLKLDTDIRRQQEQCEKKIETYQKKQQTYQKGISQAYLDRVSGILTEKEYLELTEEFRQGKQQSEKLMESEKKRLTELTERLEKGDERGKRILKYINPEFLTKEIVEELINHIVVGKKSKETGEIPVEIHWNF